MLFRRAHDIVTSTVRQLHARSVTSAADEAALLAHRAPALRYVANRQQTQFQRDFRVCSLKFVSVNRSYRRLPHRSGYARYE